MEDEITYKCAMRSSALTNVQPTNNQKLCGNANNVLTSVGGQTANEADSWIKHVATPFFYKLSEDPKSMTRRTKIATTSIKDKTVIVTTPIPMLQARCSDLSNIVGNKNDTLKKSSIRTTLLHRTAEIVDPTSSSTESSSNTPSASSSMYSLKMEDIMMLPNRIRMSRSASIAPPNSSTLTPLNSTRNLSEVVKTHNQIYENIQALITQLNAQISKESLKHDFNCNIDIKGNYVEKEAHVSQLESGLHRKTVQDTKKETTDKREINEFGEVINNKLVKPIVSKILRMRREFLKYDTEIFDEIEQLQHNINTANRK